MQDQTNAVQVMIVSTVSKSGRRYVINVPAKFENDVKGFYKKPLRIRLETLV